MPRQVERYPIGQQLRALPTYFGGKRRLLSWLGGTLDQAIPMAQWPQKRFIDLFMGGGAVSMYAKAQGFKEVIANDISLRSSILADAFLRNDRVTLSQDDALWITQPLPEEESPGFIEKTYCPSVFSTRHARALDGGFYWARRHPATTKQALLLTLLWHMANEFVAFPTSLGTSNRPFAETLDGLRDWQDLNPKRFTDGSLESLFAPTWSRLEAKRKVINQGVFGGAACQFYQEDALTLLPRLNGDILYLDPPYPGTVSYERGNKVLDALLTGDILPGENGISPFSKGTEALEQLLIKADHIPVWLLSYGNREISLEALVDLVKRHAGDREVQGFSRSYRHLSHVSKNAQNQELLVLAYPEHKTE